MGSQWVNVFYKSTINPLKIQEKRSLSDTSSTSAWQAVDFANYPAILIIRCTQNCHITASFLSAHSGGKLQGVTTWTQPKGTRAMETDSLAQEAGRHWKPWTQGKGCDIMQAFSAASCLGTLYNTQQRKERSYGCASLWISCLGFDFGWMEWQETSSYYRIQKTQVTHKQQKWTACTAEWQTLINTVSWRLVLCATYAPQLNL